MNKKAETISNPSRIRTIASRITTIIVIVGLLAGGASQLFRTEYQTEIFIHLGYPPYLMTILGVWKILGAIALLIPRFPLLKMYAYAGLFFVTTGAAVSHAVQGDVGNLIAPLMVAGITVVSWALHPASHPSTVAYHRKA